MLIFIYCIIQAMALAYKILLYTADEDDVPAEISFWNRFAGSIYPAG
jgi:hypothetical protein